MLALVALAVLAPDVPLAIENVSIVVPGKKELLTGQTVVIDKGVFADIGASGKTTIPGNARRIDGSGKYLMPGLWDMHIHWYDEKSLSLFTANGVVGVRQMFGFPMHLAWRDRANKGELAGPRIIAGSPIVDGPQPVWTMGSLKLKDPAEAPTMVSKLKSEKWDFLKVYSYIPAEAFRAFAKEASKQRVLFAGHVPLSVSVVEAANLGQRTNEHLGGLLFDLGQNAEAQRKQIQAAMETEKPQDEVRKVMQSFPPEPLESYSGPRVDRFARELAKTKMWQCPTLTVLRSISHLDQESFIKDDRLKYMSKEMRDMWNPANDFRFKSRGPKDWERDRVLYERKKSLVKPLFDAGNKFLAGTDCLNPYCFPGFSLHDELALFVEAGLTPTQALETATINPARFMGQDKKWGLVAKGMRADAVLLERNPLADIRNTTGIFSVIQGGRLHDRAALDGMLKANEQPLSGQSPRITRDAEHQRFPTHTCPGY
jgi:hypothetical protein